MGEAENSSLEIIETHRGINNVWMEWPLKILRLLFVWPSETCHLAHKLTDVGDPWSCCFCMLGWLVPARFHVNICGYAANTQMHSL